MPTTGSPNWCARTDHPEASGSVSGPDRKPVDGRTRAESGARRNHDAFSGGSLHGASFQTDRYAKLTIRRRKVRRSSAGEQNFAGGGDAEAKPVSEPRRVALVERAVFGESLGRSGGVSSADRSSRAALCSPNSAPHVPGPCRECVLYRLGESGRGFRANPGRDSRRQPSRPGLSTPAASSRPEATSSYVVAAHSVRDHRPAPSDFAASSSATFSSTRGHGNRRRKRASPVAFAAQRQPL